MCVLAKQWTLHPSLHLLRALFQLFLAIFYGLIFTATFLDFKVIAHIQQCCSKVLHPIKEMLYAVMKAKKGILCIKLANVVRKWDVSLAFQTRHCSIHNAESCINDSAGCEGNNIFFICNTQVFQTRSAPLSEFISLLTFRSAVSGRRNLIEQFCTQGNGSFFLIHRPDSHFIYNGHSSSVIEFLDIYFMI